LQYPPPACRDCKIAAPVRLEQHKADAITAGANGGIMHIGVSRSAAGLLARLSILMLVGVTALPARVAVAGDFQQPVLFDIPAQALSTALERFADQAGVQLTAPGSLVGGLRSGGVHGRYAPARALSKLLEHTGLGYRILGPRTIAITFRGRRGTHSVTDSQALDPASAGNLPPPPPLTLREVIVTARRARENLQETPVSVTAFTAADIADRGLNSIIGVAQSTPDLTIMSGGNYSGKSALTYIRGVGQDQFTYAFQPGVGYYVDGVYYGTVYGSIFELGDISDIQVLRGPQGTLFGKNNEGGAILLSTPQPKGDGSGEFEAGYGSYDRLYMKGYFDVPLVADRLSLRVFGASNRMSGYVDRIDFACAHPAESGNLQPTTTNPGCRVGSEGGDDEQSLDAALKWTPTEDLASILRASLHVDRSEAGADTLILQNPVPPGSDVDHYDTNVALPMFGIPINSPAYRTGNPFTTYATYTDPTTGYSAPPIDHQTSWSLADTTQWKTPWGFRVKNIAAFQRYRAEFVNTDSTTPLPTYLEDNVLPYRQFTEELDTSGAALGGRLDWLAGAYYFQSRGIYQGHIELPSTVVVEPGILPFAPGGVYGLNFNIDDVTRSTSRSVFLHGVYHFTPRLGLELGVRYSQDRKSQSYDHTYTAMNPVNVLLPAGSAAYPPGAGGETDDNRADPKVAIQYQWSPNLMTYVSYATGYKAGGINPKPVLASDIQPFKEEILKAYEAGVKSEWLNHRLLADGDVYYSDYTNMQLSEFLPPPLGDGGTIVINAGHARIEGAEATFKAIVLRGLSLDAGGSFLDYKTLSLGAAAGQVGGPTLSTLPPYVPRWQGSLGTEYVRDLGAYGIATARIDWSYRSKVYFDLANTEGGAQGGYGIANLRLAWTDSGGKWTAALELENLTDKLYYSSKTVTLNADGSLFSVDGTPAMPITEFFTIDRKF
jgi:iron complex outermembrane receptor protein